MANQPTAEEIQQFIDAGMSKKEAAEQLGITVQKVSRILNSSADTGETGVNLPSTDTEEKPANMFAKKYADVARTESGNAKVVVMTAAEYRAYSEANGRFEGRDPTKKVKPKVEELRALINADAKPSYIMKKFGINAEEFKQLIWELSKKELRDKPISYSLERDFIQK